MVKIPEGGEKQNQNKNGEGDYEKWFEFERHGGSNFQF
jgi:hypothetical protein